MKFKLDLISKALLLFSLTLLPLYVTGSGGVQPAHALLILFAMQYLLGHSFHIPRWSISLLGLAVYVFIIEFFYTTYGRNGGSVINAFYLFFNFIIALSIYNFCRKRNNLHTVKNGIMLSCFFAVLGVFIYGFSLKVGADGQRAIGTFNNPNQLGYFSVCAASLIFFLNRISIFKGVFAYFLIFITISLSILSLSKAAMVANIFLFVLLFMPNRIKLSNILYIFVVIFLIFTAALYLAANGYFDELVFYNRLLGMFDESDSSAEARGYFIFLDGSPVQILFGLGYDNIYDLLGHEVHSSLASVLNNYGIFGFLLFFFIMCYWGCYLYVNFGLVIFLGVWFPPFLYGLTHNGTRFVLFWVLFAVTLSVHRAKSKACKAVTS